MTNKADAETSDSLKELKEVIFDLDWEISDQSLDRLSSVLSPLKEKWKDRKPYLVCFRIIENIGQYVKKAKHSAHPEAVKLLYSVFQALDKIDSDQSFTENDRINLVRYELEKYNGLKKEITGKSAEETTAVGQNQGEQNRDSQIQYGDEEENIPQTENKIESEDNEEKEIIPTRVEGQSFPEAEQLLDDFFTEEADSLAEETDSSQVQETESEVSKEVEEDSDAGEMVEFDLGGENKEKKITNIFGVTEAELEAKVGEKLGLPEEDSEAKIEPASQPDVSEDEFEARLDKIIDEFSKEIIALLTEEVRKTIREEIVKYNKGSEEVK